MQDPRYVLPENIPTRPRRRPPAAASAGTVLTRDESAPSRARQYVSEQLPRLAVRPEVVESAVLVASELVTNAYRHGCRGDVRLMISLTDGTLTLTVADETPYSPLPDATPAVEDAECGWGLFLVSKLSRRWGHRPVAGNPQCGTAVWAELAGAML